jgi:hypothetical protein
VGWLEPAPDGKAGRDGPHLLAWYHTPPPQSLLISVRTGKITPLPPVLESYGIDTPWPIVDRGDEGIWLWDPGAMDWRCRLDGPLAKGVFPSPDLRFVLCRPRDQQRDVPIQLFDARTGKLLWQLHLPFLGGHHFAPDSRRLVISSQPRPGALRLACYDVDAKKLLWQRDWEDELCFVHFSRDTHTIAVDFHHLHRTELLDGQSGETRCMLPVGEQVGPESAFTADGRTLFVNEQRWAGTTPWWLTQMDRLLARTERDMRVVSIYDVPSGRRLFRERTANPKAWRMPQERRCVVLMSDHGIECWDIPPARPLAWIVGVPMVVGVTLVVTGKAWRPRV